MVAASNFAENNLELRKILVLCDISCVVDYRRGSYYSGTLGDCEDAGTGC